MDPEIEFKEESDSVLQADFNGHLQIVSLSSKNNESDKEPISSSLSASSLLGSDSLRKILKSTSMNEVATSKSMLKGGTLSSPSSDEGVLDWHYDEAVETKNDQVFSSHHKIMSDIVAEGDLYPAKDEMNRQQSELEKNCDTSNNSWGSRTRLRSGLKLKSSSDDFPLAEGDLILLTEAEKKRLYRMRVKQENPDLWSSIKKREAARKKELRETRRCIITEMQRTMELAAMADSSKAASHRMYLETLKERYPELWSELTNAIPATERHNERLFIERSFRNRRNLPKPTNEYKDVIEAQKKRLYRQRMKEERPEMYKRLKSKECQARRLQRQKLKTKKMRLGGIARTQSDADLNSASSTPHDADDILINFKAEEEDRVALFTPLDSITKPSEVTDRSHSANNCRTENSTTGLKSKPTDISKEAIETLTPPCGACSTQSNILWYWNDFPNISSAENPPKTTTSIPTSTFTKDVEVFPEKGRSLKINKECFSPAEKC